MRTAATAHTRPTSRPWYQMRAGKISAIIEPVTLPRMSAPTVLTVGRVVATDAMAATASAAPAHTTRSSAPVVRDTATHAAPDATIAPPDAVAATYVTARPRVAGQKTSAARAA